jgi:queuosine precursor transporter
MNELIWFLSLIFYFACTLFLYRYFGLSGLYIWIPMATILANIEVLKLIPLFSMGSVTLGNIPYASIFLATDILSENYGKLAARKAVLIGFATIIISLISMNLALAYTPALDDFAHPHIEAVFGFFWRLALGSLGAFLISQLYDIWAYDKIRHIFPKQLWLRNNGSTLISQLLDTTVFCFIAFWGSPEFPPEVFWSVYVSTYVLKALVASLDTPILYLARNWHRQGKIKAN